MAKVLVVDDSATDRELIGGLIRSDSECLVDSVAHGAEALKYLKQSLPDVVVTDLIMPEMDGIQLVTAVNENYPEIPVIVVTGQGNQRMAMDALTSGAASYVPKSQMNEMLLATVKQVLEVVQSGRSYRRLIERLADAQYRFFLENDPALIPPLVNLLQQMAQGMNVCDWTGRRRIGIALDEAILNAMYHGNLELPVDRMQQTRVEIRQGKLPELMKARSREEEFKDRRVFIEAKITTDEARFVIRDDGMGFHPGRIPQAGDPKTLEKEGGRGLILMKNLMDEVSFSDLGNKVTMIKRRVTAAR